MATSSILTNVKISGAQNAEIFVNALETASADPERKPVSTINPPLKDKEEIRALFFKMSNTYSY